MGGFRLRPRCLPRPARLCSDVCACQKGGCQCALGAVGSPGVYIHLGSLLLASAPTNQSPLHRSGTADSGPNTSYFPLSGYRCTLAHTDTHPLASALPLAFHHLSVARRRPGGSVHCAGVRTSNLNKIFFVLFCFFSHSSHSFTGSEKASKCSPSAKSPLGREGGTECFQGDGWATAEGLWRSQRPPPPPLPPPHLKWPDQIDFRQTRQSM